MLCTNPYIKGNLPFGCGQCGPCRISHRRLWTHRMMLESLCHAENSFLTLTYADEHLPKNGGLVPSDAQKFIKRLRSSLEVFGEKLGFERQYDESGNPLPLIPLRYYLVGEYGDNSFRPHYHASLFGIGPQFADLVTQSWPFGHSMLAEFNLSTAQYVCGYVTKKMTRPDDPRLVRTDENGSTIYLPPEFARMSRRPGIGATAMSRVGDTLFSDAGVASIQKTGDVPRTLQHGGRQLPLGRYLRSKLRDEIGMPQPKKIEDMSLEEYQAAPIAQYAQEMQDLQLFAQANPKYTPEETLTLKRTLLRTNKQKVRNQEARTKLFKQRKDL